MSLPLTRRIARAALLVAAGAAPVVGAAGSASAVDLPANTPVSGLNTIDAGPAADTVDGAALQAKKVAGEAGGTTVKKGVRSAKRDVAGKARVVAGKAKGALGDAQVPPSGAEVPVEGVSLG